MTNITYISEQILANATGIQESRVGKVFKELLLTEDAHLVLLSDRLNHIAKMFPESEPLYYSLVGHRCVLTVSFFLKEIESESKLFEKMIKQELSRAA